MAQLPLGPQTSYGTRAGMVGQNLIEFRRGATQKNTLINASKTRTLTGSSVKQRNYV